MTSKFQRDAANSHACSLELLSIYYRYTFISLFIAMTSAPTRIQYPYKVDYNDHFETPQCAYEHIMPLIDAVQPSPDRENHIIYDPFYCNGRTKVLLQSLGFTNVVHEKRDFYKDVEKNQLPNYHTFITNPPYSSDHKEKCVQFAIDRLRPKNSQRRKRRSKVPNHSLF